MSDLSQPAKIVVSQCVCVQKGETCLVITDAPCRPIGMAIFAAARETGAETVLMDMLPRAVDGQEPPAIVAAAMLSSDVILAPTFRSLTHTDARRAANAADARIATLPGIVEGTMLRAMRADYGRIAELSIRIAELLSSADNAHLSTELGTDISFHLRGRLGFADTGLILNKGDCGNLPAGEAFIAPVEGSSDGVIVIDGCMGDSGVLEGETIRLRVENGFAEEITGGAAARMLLAEITPYGRESRNIAELGIGTNDKAGLIGNILEDEKVLGTVHVAIGNNASMGGDVRIGIHLDGIILEPTLTIDDTLVLDRGRMAL